MVEQTKQFVMRDAQQYANQLRQPVYILRRGDSYKASVNLSKGWKLAEIVQPSVAA